MTRVQDATAFKRSNTLFAVSLGLVFIAGGLFMVRDGSDSVQTAIWMILYALAFALAQGAFIVFRYRSFRCPGCGGQVENIPDWPADEGTPVLKLCPRCDIRWRIGGS